MDMQPTLGQPVIGMLYVPAEEVISAATAIARADRPIPDGTAPLPAPEILTRLDYLATLLTQQIVDARRRDERNEARRWAARTARAWRATVDWLKGLWR